MEKENERLNETAERELVITRILNAPRELVFKAWTEPEHLAKWWGPKGFRLLVAQLDLRPGGLFHYGMESPDGQRMWGRFIYREIVAPERLVFVNSFSDAEGGITRAPFSPTWPLEMLNVLTLTEEAGKTTLILRITSLGATDEEVRTFDGGFESMRQGFGATFEQLETFLANT